jgi:hypothetical protein
MPGMLPTAKKIFDLEGEAQTNVDGVSRQEELLRCVPGEPVELRREPGNAFDPNTVNIISVRGVPIGRLTSQYAAMIAPLLDEGRMHRAKLHCLRGGLAGYPRYGARISIAWDGQQEHPHLPLDREQIRFRQRKLRARASWRRRVSARVERLVRHAAGALGP